jgi:hypothetical protein
MKSNLIIALNAIEKHDVELALIDDIKNSIEGARQMKKEIEANFAKANGGLRYCKIFDDSFKKALDTAKQVGLDVPADVMKLQAMNEELRTFFTKINSID